MRTVAVALLALLAAEAAAKIVFEEIFDKHPRKKPEKLEFEFFADDGHWDNEIVECPGDRHKVDENHKDCLRMSLDLCENPNYPDKGGCFRNEIGLLDEKDIFSFHPDEYWIGTSFYMPDDFEVDPLKTSHVQIKANGGAEFSPGAPNFLLVSQYGYWGVGVRGSADCLETCRVDDAIVEYIAPVEPGKWADFVFHMSFSQSDKRKGFIRVFMNRQLVWEQYNLINAYKSPENYGMFVKWGVYKHQWGEGVQEVGYKTTHVETTVNAFIVARGDPGEDLFDEVDTSPRCDDLSSCCKTCVKGEPNPLYNERRCKNMCNDAAAGYSQKKIDKYCKAQKECDDVRSCCKMCKKDGSHNKRFSESRCFQVCRDEQHELAGSKRFKKNCFQLAQADEGCGSDFLRKAGLKCQHGCHQDPFSFSCTCPEGFVISNKNGYECQEVKEAKIKNKK